MTTLLGRPVHLHANANISTKCMRFSCFQDLKCLKGEKCDLSDFDHGIIFGTRKGGLSISETADLLGYRDCRECQKNKKHPVRSSSVGRRMLVMEEVRGEGPDCWSKLTGRRQ